MERFARLISKEYAELQRSLSQAVENSVGFEGAVENLWKTSPSELSCQHVDNLLRYLNLLNVWTKKIDLVSEASVELLITRHIVDSLAAQLLLSADIGLNGGGILDVGSGAGLPGVVLAILNSDKPVFLCEPREKRVLFLRDVKRQLGLSNVFVLQKRIEQISGDDCGDLSVVIARAVGLDSLVLEHGLKLLRSSGVVVIMSGAVGSESVAQSVGHKTTFRKLDYSLVGDERGRSLLVWQKL